MTNEERVIGLCRAAKTYFALGLKCFPAYIWEKDGKKGMMFGKKDSEFSGWGSTEHTYDTFIARIKSLQEVGKVPNSIAIATGTKSGITVIDSDSESSEAYLKQFEKCFAGCATVKTKRGIHRYFKYCEGSRTMAGEGVRKGVDIRSNGGLVFAPPSENKEWINSITSISALPEFPIVLKGIMFGYTNISDRKNQIKAKYDGPRMSLGEVEGMLQTISSAFPDMAYDKWLNVCMALWSEYSFEEVWPLLRKYQPVQYKTADEFMYRQKHDKPLTQISMGTFRFIVSEALDVILGSKEKEIVDPLVTVEKIIADNVAEVDKVVASIAEVKVVPLFTNIVAESIWLDLLKLKDSTLKDIGYATRFIPMIRNDEDRIDFLMNFTEGKEEEIDKLLTGGVL
jgi:hypothetical protein